MSLINEALKKAQRQRNEGPVDLTDASSGGEGRIAKHVPARSAKTMILLAGGAVALVVVSVILTFFLVNRPREQTPPGIAVAPVAPPPKAEEKPLGPIVLPPPAESPVVQMPVAQTPVATPPPTSPTIAPAPVTPPVVAVAPPSASPPLVPVATPQPVAAPPPPAVPTARTAAPATDERVHAFVEGLRISGVKAAGAESRVLMNDRFFRINDIVDRALGVKLIKVEADKLTFADANGVAYEKFY